MSADTTFYRDLAYVFGAAVVGGAVVRSLRQPIILGYVLGGILIGPFTPGPTVAGVHEFELLAEIGVILRMYSIGLEFSFRDLLRVKWVALLGAPLGILLSIALGLGTGALLGWSWQPGVTVGAVISVASTMVLSRFLAERGELRSPAGQVMIAITLVEDLAVIVLTVLLPSLSDLGSDRALTLGLALGKALLLLIPVTFIARKLLPALMRRVVRAGNPELFVLAALALGAFLAGLLVSESNAGHQTLQHLLPLRDAFVALFFVTMGILVNPRILVWKPSLLLVIVALVVVGKSVIWVLVVKLFRYSTRTSLLVGLGLTQIGEFSYVLVRVARDAHIVGDDMYNAVLAASVVTILINGLLLRLADKASPASAGR